MFYRNMAHENRSCAESLNEKKSPIELLFDFSQLKGRTLALTPLRQRNFENSRLNAALGSDFDELQVKIHKIFSHFL
jgi:hypothetical protein